MRRAAVLAALVLVALAFVALRPSATPGPVLRDFEAYYAAGATWFGEGDAYGRDVWRVERHVPGVDGGRDELLPFVGPPYSLPLWGIFGALPFERAALLWGITLAAAAVLIALCIARLAAPLDVPAVAALLLLAAAFGPLTSALALGQVAVVAFAGIVATTVALESRVRLVVPILGTLLAALQPNIAVALAVRLGDRRACGALLIAAFFALACGLAALGGIAGAERYIAVLTAHAGAERTIAIQLTAGAIAFGFGTSERAAQVIALCTALVVLLATGLAFVARGYAPASRVAIACAALPLVVPFSHEHDLCIALLPAVLLLRRGMQRAWPLAACATVAVAVDWLGLAQRPSAVPQSIALALAAAFACVALAERPSLRGAALPVLLAVAVSAVGLVAAQHPAPVWPYALGASFQAPLSLDASGVWRLEQVRSGLATPNATWALLRAFSLGGCALLWAASLAVFRCRRS